MNTKMGLLALVLGAGFALPVQAEEVVFKCWFDWVCDPDTGTCEDAGEDIRFKVDVDSQAVSRIGGDPLSEFSLLLGDRAVTILELPISGGTSTTTVKISNGESVHSVNSIEGNTLVARQYLGECVTL